MNLPIYQIIHVKSAQLEDVVDLLDRDMNLRRPVALLLKSLSPDEQREVIGLVENWFETHNVSWHFPYPVFCVADHGDAIAHMSVVAELSELPRFYQQKDVKVTVKETQVLERNRLLQQEITNAGPHVMADVGREYGSAHRWVWELARETDFYQSLLRRLRAKGRANG